MARPKLSDFEKRLRSEIAANLKSVSHGMTQREISEKTDIPASTLSGYFNETSTIIPENLEKLASFFNVSPGSIDPRQKTTFLDNISINGYAEHYKHLRIANRESIEKLSQQTGVDAEKIKNFENGITSLSNRELISIASYFGDDLTLLSGDDSIRRLYSLNQSEKQKELVSERHTLLSSKVINHVRRTLSHHGYKLLFEDENDYDSYYIFDKNTSKRIDITYDEIFEFYDSLVKYITAAEENFILFKIKELENKL